MKAIRILMTLIGALVAVVLTLIIIFLYNPSWQRALFESILESDRARAWQLGQISLSPGRLELREVFVLSDQVGVEVKRVQVEGALWAGLWKRSLEIKSGEVEGLYLDLTKIGVGGRNSEDWASFVQRLEGDPQLWKDRLALVLSRVEANGWSVRLEQLQIAGGVLLPGERYIPVNVRIEEADSAAPGEMVVEILPRLAGEEI
jgi:hypothetical protein